MKIVVLYLLLLIIGSCNYSRIYSTSTIQQLSKSEYLEKLNKCSDFVLLDVRTAHEYKKAHMEGAKNISFIFNGFGRKIRKLDNSQTIFLYCQTAHRSPLATKKLKKAGFENIYDLKGGYSKMREGFVP